MTAAARRQRFSFRSRRLALDFAGTLMFREGPDPPQELLHEPSSLADWLVSAGLVDDRLAVSRRDLSESIALREAIYRLAMAVLSGRPPGKKDQALLNRVAAVPSVVTELRGFGRMRRHGDPSQALASIARDAVALFGGPEVTRLRQCRRPGCTRLFLDRSRGHNRIWCGMRECGNRVNAAAYRRRRATTDKRRGRSASGRGELAREVT